jgi:hypothetical protein
MPEQRRYNKKWGGTGKIPDIPPTAPKRPSGYKNFLYFSNGYKSPRKKASF